MFKRVVKRVMLAVFGVMSCVAIAGATVITFDDLDQGLVPNGYAGVTWGTSTLSLPYADFTSFSVYNNTAYSMPYSSPNFVINGYGVPDLWFEFGASVTFNGAWFAAPANNQFAAQKVRFVDDLGQMSPWLTMTNTPQFLAADFVGSQKIYVQPTLQFSGVDINGGWFAMDDLTYSSTTAVPEPSTIVLLMAGFSCLGIAGRKFRSQRGGAALLETMKEEQ